MKTPDSLNIVAEFHKTFKSPVLDTPQIPHSDRANLRYNLLEEELLELKAAIDAGDLVAVADAFADLQYVLSGAILEFGMGDKFDALFNEVHRSNMSKACETWEETQETRLHYIDKGQECYFIKNSKTGKFNVYRMTDDKLLKSINYSPANLKGILGK